MERRSSNYNVLHAESTDAQAKEEQLHDTVDTHGAEGEEEHEESDSGHHKSHHKHAHKKEVVESFDFNDVESMMWRKVSSCCWRQLYIH
jgi:G3E family GTPase